MNPHIKYKCGERKNSGMAIILKDLLSVLDQLSIDHADEATLRRLLRQKKNVLTSAKQRFLDNDYDDKITRSNSHQYSCILLPKEDIPDSFLERLTEGLH